jgi:hypothetical protein
MTFVDPRAASAQAPCSVARVLVDSAKDEVLNVLTSGGQVVQELRQDLRITKLENLRPFEIVRDPATCIRLAPNFGRTLEPGTRFVVLRVGPMYYARDPDQNKATGFIADTAYKVLVRLGAAIP